jgi:ADP-heptose:LPS heptosyltransferase
LKNLLSKIAWHANRFVCANLELLNFLGGELSVISMFRSPGDTLLAGTVCRLIKARYPRIRINCQVEFPELLRFDPAIATLNGPTGRWYLYFEYLGLIEQKNASTNVLTPVLNTIGIHEYSYKCRVYLTGEEREKARFVVGKLDRPLITINVMSRETVKNWKLDYWKVLLNELCKDFAVVQLGDKTEPFFPEVTSFAGKLSLRESMAVLALSQAHIGPDSFLMHAANGVDVPAVIIFGGSRTAGNLGYSENENLYEKTECSPCWIHRSKGEVCGHEMKCMTQITPDRVLAAFHRLRARHGRR